MIEPICRYGGKWSENRWPRADELSGWHFVGSAYDMGFAMGTLMKPTAVALITDVWHYLETTVEQAINGGTVTAIVDWGGGC